MPSVNFELALGPAPAFSIDSKASPHLVRDIYPGSRWSNREPFFAFQDTLYFIADYGIHDHGRWRADGTGASTVLALNAW